MRGLVDVEMRDFGRETSGGDFVHAPTRLGEFTSELHFFILLPAPSGRFFRFGLGEAARGAEGDGAGHEADEVVHFGRDFAGEAGRTLG